MSFKYCGHESFSIRKNWLQKGLRNIDDLKGGRQEVTSMDKTGLGRNMVKSLRYWLRVTGLAAAGKEGGLSSLGEIVNQHDSFIQETGTLWLLQWKISTNKELATSWYYLFNELNMTGFSEEDFVRGLQKWDEMESDKPAAVSSFVKDFDCIRHTYIPHPDEDPESNMACPLSELGLLRYGSGGEIRKSVPLENGFPPLVLLAAIAGRYTDEDGEMKREIRLSSLLNDKGSPGKVFNMDSVLLLGLLGGLENRGLVQVVRTAGLDVVRMKEALSFEDAARMYYEELGR